MFTNASIKIMNEEFKKTECYQNSSFMNGKI